MDTASALQMEADSDYLKVETASALQVETASDLQMDAASDL